MLLNVTECIKKTTVQVNANFLYLESNMRNYQVIYVWMRSRTNFPSQRPNYITKNLNEVFWFIPWGKENQKQNLRVFTDNKNNIIVRWIFEYEKYLRTWLHKTVELKIEAELIESWKFRSPVQDFKRCCRGHYICCCLYIYLVNQADSRWVKNGKSKQHRPVTILSAVSEVNEMVNGHSLYSAFHVS